MTPRTLRGGAAIALLACGCSYDWSIPTASSPADAGNDIDATVLADAGAPDAFDASDAALDAPAVDAGVDAALSCDSLIAAAESAYARARACAATTVVGTVCTATVKDQCGCTKPVADDSSTATSDYEKDVTAIKQASCAAGCGTCPAPKGMACLDMATGDGGFALVCQ